MRIQAQDRWLLGFFRILSFVLLALMCMCIVHIGYLFKTVAGGCLREISSRS